MSKVWRESDPPTWQDVAYAAVYVVASVAALVIFLMGLWLLMAVASA